MERLGGLAKRMPVTALAFVLAGAAISGLPPGGAFFGELLVYVAGGIAAMDLPLPSAGYAWACVAGLALIGGLSVIGFTRASGIVFLGEPRTDDAARAHDPNLSMRAAMVFLRPARRRGPGLPALFRMICGRAPLLAGQSPTCPPRHPLWSIPRPASNPPLDRGRRDGPGPGLVLVPVGRTPGPGRRPGHLGLRLCIRPRPRMQYTASSYRRTHDRDVPPVWARRAGHAAPGAFPGEARPASPPRPRTGSRTDVSAPFHRRGVRPATRSKASSTAT
jgi:hydrogenase-4 component B